MASITEADIRGFIRERQAAGKGPGTINKHLVQLSAACNHARELGWNIPNPAAGKKLPEPEGRVRWLKPEEAARLIQSAAQLSRAPWLVDYIVLSLNTGCRAGELLGLEWSRVDLRAGLFYLEAQHTKSRKRRSVPLNESAWEALLSRARFRAEHCPEKCAPRSDSAIRASLPESPSPRAVIAFGGPGRPAFDPSRPSKGIGTWLHKWLYARSWALQIPSGNPPGTRATGDYSARSLHIAPCLAAFAMGVLPEEWGAVDDLEAGLFHGTGDGGD